MKKDNNILKLGHDTISRDPFPNSKKVYIKGSIYPNINVGMREIEISESDNFFSTNPKNNSAFYSTYDTSGPYTDNNIDIDITKGLPKIREKWITDRGDVEFASNFSSVFTNNERKKKDLIPLKFLNRKPLVAKKGSNVTQMHYAKQGIITPEMEYIAIREN